MRFPLLVAALLFTLPSAAASEERDQVVLAIGRAKSTQVKVFSIDGTLHANLRVNAGRGSDFISGDWDGSGASVAALSSTRRAATLEILRRDGAVLARLPLGKLRTLHTVLSADLDESGFDDVVVVRRSGHATVYLDPGVQTGQMREIALPKADHYQIARSGTTAIGIAALRARGQSAQVFDSHGAAILSGSIPITKSDQPLSLNSALPSFAIPRARTVRSFSLAGAIGSFGVPADAAFVSGSFTAPNRPEVLAAERWGGFTIFDGETGEQTLPRFTLNAAQGEEDAPDPCLNSEANDLLEQLSILIQQGRYAEAERLANRIKRGTADPACLNVQGNDPSKFNNRYQGSELVGRALRVVGGAALMCDEFAEPRDGGKRGFLMKNGDTTNKIVVLLPGDEPKYERVELLDGRYRLIESLRDAGYGNPDDKGMRQHRRGKANLSAYPGTVIVRAILGSKERCWRVRRGRSTRID